MVRDETPGGRPRDGRAVEAGRVGRGVAAAATAAQLTVLAELPPCRRESDGIGVDRRVKVSSARGGNAALSARPQRTETGLQVGERDANGRVGGLRGGFREARGKLAVEGSEQLVRRHAGGGCTKEPCTSAGSLDTASDMTHMKSTSKEMLRQARAPPPPPPVPLERGGSIIFAASVVAG